MVSNRPEESLCGCIDHDTQPFEFSEALGVLTQLPKPYWFAAVTQRPIAWRVPNQVTKRGAIGSARRAAPRGNVATLFINLQ